MTVPAAGRPARSSPLQRQVIARIRLALDLDPNSAEANASLGGALWVGWELAAGERALRRAIELNPNYASAHQWLGRCLLAQGRIDEALRELKTAALLDPLSSRIADNLGRGLCAAGRFTEAGAVYDQALALQPRSFQALRQKAWVLKRLGQPAEAAAILRSFSDQDWPSQAIRVEALAVGGLWPEATAAFTGFDASVTDIAIMLAYLGRAEEALAALNPDAAVSMMIDQWLFDAAVDPIRPDPRFAQFLATLGLTDAHARAQAWRAAQSRK